MPNQRLRRSSSATKRRSNKIVIRFNTARIRNNVGRYSNSTRFLPGGRSTPVCHWFMRKTGCFLPFTRAFQAHLANAGIPAGAAARLVARAGWSAAAGGTAGASRVVRDAMQQSFVHAMHAGIVAAAAAMLCASVVSYLLVRSHVTHTNTGDRQVS